MSWILPTSHNDPDGAWTDEANAYDDDILTYAFTFVTGSYLELPLSPPIPCDKVRFLGKTIRPGFSEGDANVDIDVYYGGAWNNIHSGQLSRASYQTVLVGSEQLVSSARIKWNILASSFQGWVYGFAFWGAIDVRRSLIDYLWSRLTTDSLLKTIMGGTVRCYLTWATPDAEFPYLVHRLDIRNEPGAYPIMRASYFLDIWSNSDDASEVSLIRQRIIQLLDQLVFSTDDVDQCHIEFMSDGDIPVDELGIRHYAFIWEIIFRRDSEATSIEGR